eukprot:5268432-Pleurochrysis_carterae.AAC.1
MRTPLGTVVVYRGTRRSVPSVQACSAKPTHTHEGTDGLAARACLQAHTPPKGSSPLGGCRFAGQPLVSWQDDHPLYCERALLTKQEPNHPQARGHAAIPPNHAAIPPNHAAIPPNHAATPTSNAYHDSEYQGTTAIKK